LCRAFIFKPRLKLLVCVVLCAISFSILFQMRHYFEYWHYLHIFQRFGYVVTAALGDRENFQMEKDLSLQNDWKMRKLEQEFGKTLCLREQTRFTNNSAWITAIANEEYVIPAVVLGHTLNLFSCHHKMVALITDEVSQISANALSKVGFDVRVIPRLDCRSMGKSKGIDIPISKGGIYGTHTKFHCWNLTEFDKLVYFDADIMLLSNVDEMLDLDAQMAASWCDPPGMKDIEYGCFNAGILVLKTSTKIFQELLQTWSEIFDKFECEEDQQLLFHYFASKGNWTPLPFAFNVRRMVHHPMLIYHFAGRKPWKSFKSLPSGHDGPLLEVEDIHELWKKYFSDAVRVYQLDDWWSSVKRYCPVVK